MLVLLLNKKPYSIATVMPLVPFVRPRRLVYFYIQRSWVFSIVFESVKLLLFISSCSYHNCQQLLNSIVHYNNKTKKKQRKKMYFKSGKNKRKKEMV